MWHVHRTKLYIFQCCNGKYSSHRRILNCWSKCLMEIEARTLWIASGNKPSLVAVQCTICMMLCLHKPIAFLPWESWVCVHLSLLYKFCATALLQEVAGSDDMIQGQLIEQPDLEWYLMDHLMTSPSSFSEESGAVTCEECL
jgi:hypothetical protein